MTSRRPALLLALTACTPGVTRPEPLEDYETRGFVEVCLWASEQVMPAPPDCYRSSEYSFSGEVVAQDTEPGRNELISCSSEPDWTVELVDEYETHWWLGVVARSGAEVVRPALTLGQGHRVWGGAIFVPDGPVPSAGALFDEAGLVFAASDQGWAYLPGADVLTVELGAQTGDVMAHTHGCGRIHPNALAFTSGDARLELDAGEAGRLSVGGVDVQLRALEAWEAESTSDPWFCQERSWMAWRTSDR